MTAGVRTTAAETTVAEVTLFGHWICPYSVRVEFALAQQGRAYEVVEVPPTAARPRDFVVPAEFIAHSPRGEIPMIKVGDTFLADSLPILDFLAPDPPAIVTQRSHWIDAHVFPPMIGIYYGTDRERIERAAGRLADAFGEIDDWLAETGWLAGPGPTTAEAVLVPVYVRLEGLRRLGFTTALPPRVQEHRERCEQLRGGSAVRWTAEQVDEFIWRFETYRRRVAERVGERAGS